MATPVPADYTVTVPVATTGAADMVITKPSTVVNGDLLLVFIGVGNEPDGSQTITAPAGWTQQSATYANNVYLSVFTKIASSEPSTWNFPITNSIGHSQYRMGSCSRFTDPYASSPVDAISLNIPASFTLPAFGGPVTFSNTITPTITNDLILILTFTTGSSGPATVYNVSSYAIATSNPASWSELFDSFGVVATSRQVSMSLGYATRPQTTATGNPSININTDTGANSTTAGVALIALSRNLITNASVQDTQVASDHIVGQGLYGVRVTETQNTTDDISAEESKVWNEDSKPTTNWTEDQK